MERVVVDHFQESIANKVLIADTQSEQIIRAIINLNPSNSEINLSEVELCNKVVVCMKNLSGPKLTLTRVEVCQCTCSLIEDNIFGG